MSKNTYKTPNSVENQIDEIEQQNTSMLSNIVIFGVDLTKLFNIFTRNFSLEKPNKPTLNVRETIYSIFFKNNKSILPLKIAEPLEETIFNKIKPNNLVQFKILNRQKAIVGRFTKRILEQAIKKNQIGRAV